MSTKIEWADETWGIITGCTKVSDGCAHCYAERMSKRLAGRCGYPKDEPFKVTLHPEKLAEPLKWKKPRKIFVNSMSDLFHEDVPDEFIARVWWVMGQCAGYLDPSRYRGHTFMILTKRPKRMKDWLDGWRDQETRKRWIESFGEMFDWMSGPRYWPDVLPNVWLGVSVENQVAADERIPLLLQASAAVRFISAEPLLSEINISRYLKWPVCKCWCPDGDPNKYGKYHWEKQSLVSADWVGIDRVIVGGESGPGARPMHPDWVRSLRDQCQAAGTKFFFKQWGEWIVPEDGAVACRVCGCTWHNACNDGCYWVEPGLCGKCVGKPIPTFRAVKFRRVGKKKAGRELDGRTWDEMPEIGVEVQP